MDDRARPIDRSDVRCASSSCFCLTEAPRQSRASLVNDLHLQRTISRLLKWDRHRNLSFKKKGGASMTLLQSDRNNVIMLANFSPPPAPLRRIADAYNVLLSPVLRRLADRSRKRRERTQITLAERLRQRRMLARLSERDLKDIGLSRYDVEMELRKPFWR
jgi:uncharacterized protein YjiS (DUF1127 family)